MVVWRVMDLVPVYVVVACEVRRDEWAIARSADWPRQRCQRGYLGGHTMIGSDEGGAYCKLSVEVCGSRCRTR